MYLELHFHLCEIETVQKPDGFGIRIESLVLVKPAVTYSLPASDVAQEDLNVESKSVERATKFLAFETLTLTPIDPRLVDAALLSSEQIQWLNDYNRLVRQTLEPELRRRGLREAFNWIVSRTTAISL